jgi:hypothetical protein
VEDDAEHLLEQWTMSTNGKVLTTAPTNERRAFSFQVTEEVRKMMLSIFASMEVELVKFLAHFEKVDSFNSMYSYVRLSSHVLQVSY